MGRAAFLWAQADVHVELRQRSHHWWAWGMLTFIQLGVNNERASITHVDSMEG
jgi:hypothetical protein